MSCFIHERETYNKLFQFIYSCAHGVCSTILKETPYSFVKTLAQYNSLAFAERYEGRHAEDNDTFEDYTPAGEGVIVPLSPTEAYKLLMSVDYQNSDSSKYCEKFQLKLQYMLLYIQHTWHVTEDSLEYKEARWS